MTEKLIIALLALLSIGSLAAVFILWAKLDEQKKLTQEEREKRWDEISRAESIDIERDYLESKCKFLEAFNDRCLEVEIENRMIVERERNALQDRLSALLCPTNNHVWKDGVCVNCGRVQDA